MLIDFQAGDKLCALDSHSLQSFRYYLSKGYCQTIFDIINTLGPFRGAGLRGQSSFTLNPQVMARSGKHMLAKLLYASQVISSMVTGQPPSRSSILSHKEVLLSAESSGAWTLRGGGDEVLEGIAELVQAGTIEVPSFSPQIKAHLKLLLRYEWLQWCPAHQ